MWKDEDFWEIVLLQRRIRMKRSSRIHQYIRRFGPLLIVGVLIAGLAGCDGSCSSTPAEYELNTSSSGGGHVVISGEGTYADGTIVTIEAVANECYEFIEWTGADVADPYSPVTTVTMDEAKSIAAVFALLSYELTTDSTDGGAVTSPGEGTSAYDCGMDVPLVATAEEGYYFVNWSGDVDTIANVNAYTTTVTIMGDYSITANFELICSEEFVLTISSTEGGEVTSPGEGTFPYICGTVVDLVAEADLGYHFVEWTVNTSTVADVDAAETTITMSGNYSVTADFGPFSGGNGTAEDPYQIADWYRLDDVRNYLSSYFILINDLDSDSIGYTELASSSAHDGRGWQPIGVSNSTFVGSFDGQGYDICDLFINRPDETEVGLFGAVGQVAVIGNVGVAGNVTGNENTGGLVGKNEGTVSNSYSTCNVIGDLNVGGLVGKSDNSEGAVNNSYATGNVTGNDNVGGLLGWNREGTGSNSYATGRVTGSDSVGGLIGKNSDTTSNSYATGRVTGSDNVGGLVGRNDNTGSVIDSYSTGSVTGGLHVGGLIGRNQGTVTSSFWDTETSGQGSSDGGTGKTPEQMKDFATFDDAGWDITTVTDSSTRNTDYIWNIFNTVTYPFLSWQPV
jgi:hypothetical protein